MKNIIIKIIVGLLIVVFLGIGLVPDINLFLKNHITFQQYTYLIVIIAFIVFELLLYLKNDKAMSKTFKMLETSMEFTKYKKEKRYKENKDFYYCEIPFNKDLFKVFWIAYQYGIIKTRAKL